MRNIIALLYRYNAVLVFLVLEVVAVSLYLSNNYYQRSSWFNSSSAFVGWFKDVKHSIVEPFDAVEENRQLRKENAKLLNQLPTNFYRTESGKVVINDTLYSQQYTYVPCQVIDNSYNRQQNYILINAGTSKGIEPDMGVVGPDGIIGFIKDAGTNYSLVIPVLNPNFKTAVKLKKNDYFGQLEWDGEDYRLAQVNGVINTIPIEEGDTIVTRGARGRFPEGIMVGTVSKVEEVQGDPHYDMAVKLSSDFPSLHHAYVIINHHKSELDNIRSLIKE